VAVAHLAAEQPEEPVPGPTCLQRLVFDEGLPNSVLSCVTFARENARSIRDAIASEIWEALNVLYLRLQDEASGPPSPTGQLAVLYRVQEVSHLVQGLRDNVMVRSDEWHFLRLGRYLERADNTLRAQDRMFRHPALTIAAGAGQEIDTLHLAAALRVAAAFEAFSRTAPTLGTERVLEFLLLDARFPRSVEFCVQELERSLHALSRTPEDIYTNEAEQRCGRLVAELRFASIDEILAQGLPETLARVLGTVGAIGRAISEEYFT
jgi:uncharacterized alpha-E superfamily protein